MIIHINHYYIKYFSIPKYLYFVEYLNTINDNISVTQFLSLKINK